MLIEDVSQEKCFVIVCLAELKLHCLFCIASHVVGELAIHY